MYDKRKDESDTVNADDDSSKRKDNIIVIFTDEDGNRGEDDIDFRIVGNDDDKCKDELVSVIVDGNDKKLEDRRGINIVDNDDSGNDGDDFSGDELKFDHQLIAHEAKEGSLSGDTLKDITTKPGYHLNPSGYTSLD